MLTDSALVEKDIVSGRPFQINASSEEVVSLARQWLNRCLENHHDSCPSEISMLPTRLVDVGDESHPPRLYVTHHEYGVWVALSHCWGRQVRFVTESGSLAHRQQAMNLEDVPATFHDAILATRRLGYRYIWIDSLCILQDSIEDWAYESSQMQHYYKNAILTIATDHLAGDHESFFNTARPQHPTSVQIPFHTTSISTPIHVHVRDHVHLPGYENDNAPLNVRGWTLQENLLSPRTLHYTEQQVVFECQRYSLTESDITPRGTTDADVFTTIKRYFLKPECGRQDLSVQKYPTMANYYDPLFRWYQILEEFYRRSLTFEDDRFAAISGLAREISQQTKMIYKAGIWVEDFHIGLLWNSSCRGSLPRTYRAPSWSWASLDLNMAWGQNMNPSFELYLGPKNYSTTCQEAELLDAEVKLADGDPYGRLLSGSLRLKSRWLPYSLWRGKTPTYFATYWRKPMYHHGPPSGQKPDGRDQLICSFDEDEQEEQVEEDKSESESEKQKRSVDEPDAEKIRLDLGTHPQTSRAGSTVPSESYPEQDEFSIRESTHTSLSPSENEEEEEEDEEDLHSWDPATLSEVSMLQTARCTSKSGQREISVFYALLLRPAIGYVGCFRRVGIVEIPDVDGLGVDGWESKVCVIV